MRGAKKYRSVLRDEEVYERLHVRIDTPAFFNCIYYRSRELSDGIRF